MLPAIAVFPHAASGAGKILAVSRAKRSPHLPAIPTLKEVGIDGEADARNGMIAPGAHPGPLVARIRREVVEAIGTSAIREMLAAQLLEPVGITPEEFRARIEAEVSRWEPVIKGADIKVN